MILLTSWNKAKNKVKLMIIVHFYKIFYFIHNYSFLIKYNRKKLVFNELLFVISHEGLQPSIF